MRKPRSIVHVDMDAFFAAIEQRDNPQYRSKPVVVGADPRGGKGRGVVSTCSYEARRFGIHSAMPISHAYRKCPHAIYLTPDMERYAAVSAQIFTILNSFTPDIEPIGVDEAFLDITGSHHLFGTPVETCLTIKSRIKSETGLTASVGLAPTMMAAKIASDLKKPDGMVVVKPDELLEFLRPLEIRRIWGLGPKAEEALTKIGIRTIGDIAAADIDRLEELFGSSGRHFWQLANGIDERSVSNETEAQSVSNETTFDIDTRDTDLIEGALMQLCEKVSARLRGDRIKCRTVTLKIRLTGFHTYTRSVTLVTPTNFSDILYKDTKSLYNKFDTNGRAIRLIGVKASRLIDAGIKETLFSDSDDLRREKTHRAIDTLRNKFGEDVICHAKSRIEREPER